ncbi:MAG: outer membrane beta-barrel protein [Bacteroidota bacterium]
MQIAKSLLILFTILLVSFNAKAQKFHFGATLNLGASKVTSPLLASTEVRYSPSGNVGFYAEKAIKGKTTIGINLLWVQIEGRDIDKNQELYGSSGQWEILEKIGTATVDSRLHATYIGIPAYVRFQSGKFGLKLGIQTLIFVHANAINKIDGVKYGQPFSAKSTYKSVELNLFDWGPKAGIDYPIGKKFRLNLDYYFGIGRTKSVLKGRQNRQATLGVSYQFQ